MTLQPDSQSKPVVEIRPAKGLFDLDLRSLISYRDLLFFLVWREIKIRYRQAVLGIAWAVIQPVLAVVIFTVIFGYFARFPSEGVPYTVFAFSATLPWTFFAAAVQRSAEGLVADGDLVRKVYFPRLVIPAAMVLAPLVDFVVAFFVFLIVLVWYQVPLTLNILALPAVLLVALGLAFAMGLLLAPLNVRYRDIKHTLPFVLQIWMYATPIVYPLSMIPERWQGLYSLNPMVGVIEGFRWALLGKAAPDLTAMLIGGVVICVALGVAVVLFSKHERTFADVI